MGSPTLPRRFFSRSAESLAADLLGQRLVRVLPDGTRLAGVIIECEAYIGVRDRASHAFGGHRTPRNESMYSTPGTAYVYFTYGMHFCFNIVCGRVRSPAEPVAVLVRALQPVEGLDEMARARSTRRKVISPPLRPCDLCSGPGKLCQAMSIDRTLDRADLVNGESLFVERVRRKPFGDGTVAVTPRIGIGFAADWVSKPLRWAMRGNPHVSIPVP